MQRLLEIADLKIIRLAKKDAAALDGGENSFTSNEQLEVSLEGGTFRWTVKSVAPFTKAYEAEDEIDDDVEIYGAYIGDTLAGKIELASTWNDLASIEHIVVARSHRKHGVATQLISFAKDWARDQQLKGIRLETQTNNAPACKLYFRNGFEIGGIDQCAYRTQASVANETALYLYWFPKD